MTTLTVVVDETWLSDPTDPDPTHAVQVVCPAGPVITSITGGRVDPFGKTYRVITTDSESVTAPVHAEGVSFATKALLDAWRGTVLLLRHENGMKMFGAYLQLQATPVWVKALADGSCGDGYLWTVDLTFQRVATPAGIEGAPAPIGIPTSPPTD